MRFHLYYGLSLLLFHNILTDCPKKLRKEKSFLLDQSVLGYEKEEIAIIGGIIFIFSLHFMLLFYYSKPQDIYYIFYLFNIYILL